MHDAAHNFYHVCLHPCHMQVAPTAVRGALGTLNQLVICLGILGALLVNVALPVTEWRTMFTIGALPAVALALGGFQNGDSAQSA